MKAAYKTISLGLAVLFSLTLVSCRPNGTTSIEQDENKSGQSTTSVEDAAGTSSTTQSNNLSTTPTTSKTTRITEPEITTIPGDSKRLRFIESVKGFVLDIKNPWNGAPPGTAIYKSTNAVEQTVESRFGVTINETGLTTQYNQAVASSLAAGRPLADLLMLQGFDFYNYFTKNYFARLNVPMETSGVTFTEPWYNQGAKSFFNIDGKQLAWIGAKGDPYTILYNKTMLKSSGLKEPVELVANGQWTFDKLKDYSKKLTTSGRNGLESPSTVDFLISLVDSDGGKLYHVDKTGKLQTNYNAETSRNGMQRLYDWSKDKTVVFPTGDWDQAYKNFITKKTAMLHATGHWQNLLPSDFGDEVGVVVFPKGPKATTYADETYINWISFIPNKMQNDAAKILFLRNEMWRVSYTYWKGDYPEQQGKYLMKNSKSYNEYYNLVYGLGGYKTGVEAVGLLFPTSGDMCYKTMADKMVGPSAKTPSQIIGEHGKQLDAATEKTWGKYKFTGLAEK
ncbi:MAG: hypothetical protein BGN88_12750 [Clostridiales bacterium 43-6]|nr:MAG: hypothetical protein BGN88_12750 [Clostridiales bacterium 43-6]